MNRFLSSLLLLLLSGFCAVSGEEWTGKVVGVSDGDTLTVMRSGKGEKVRLHGIDAPEKTQAFGEKARQFTSAACFGKDARVVVHDTDRYGRTVGEVWVGGVCHNLALVKAGFAWHYRQYSKDEAYAQAEAEARKAKAGLWKDANPVAPWEFRRQEAEKRAKKNAAEAAATAARKAA